MSEPKKIEFKDLKIGTPFASYTRAFDFLKFARVEAIGHDWAVARDKQGYVHLVLPDDHIHETEEDDDAGR